MINTMERLVDAKKLANSLETQGDTFLRGHGLTTIQFLVLDHLSIGGEQNQSELALWFGCNRSNVTGLVDRLEILGYVERRPIDGDRRVNVVALTGPGKDMVKKLSGRFTEHMKQVWER